MAITKDSSREEACLQAGFSGNLYMENCLDLAVRTEGIAGSVIPTIEQQQLLKHSKGFVGFCCIFNGTL